MMFMAWRVDIDPFNISHECTSMEDCFKDYKVIENFLNTPKVREEL
jgi:hypothetical protein